MLKNSTICDVCLNREAVLTIEEKKQFCLVCYQEEIHRYALDVKKSMMPTPVRSVELIQIEKKLVEFEETKANHLKNQDSYELGQTKKEEQGFLNELKNIVARYERRLNNE